MFLKGFGDELKSFRQKVTYTYDLSILQSIPLIIKRRESGGL